MMWKFLKHSIKKKKRSKTWAYYKLGPMWNTGVYRVYRLTLGLSWIVFSSSWGKGKWDPVGYPFLHSTLGACFHLRPFHLSEAPVCTFKRGGRGGSIGEGLVWALSLSCHHYSPLLAFFFLMLGLEGWYRSLCLFPRGGNIIFTKKSLISDIQGL